MLTGKEQHFDCPECKTAQIIDMVDSVNVAETPEAKQRVCDRTLLLHTCSVCGHKTETLYPFVYHDPGAKLMVYFVPSTEREVQEQAAAAIALMNEAIGFTAGLAAEQGLEDARASYEYRIVATYNELLEKIYARDLGLDDRVLELVKLYYLGQLGSQAPMENLAGFFLVDDGGTPTFAISFTDGQEGASAFHAQVYDKLAADFEERVTDDAPTGFRVVDQSWAMGVFPQLVGIKEAEAPTEH